MDDRQRAKFNMFIVVRGFLDGDPTPWNGIPKFVTEKTNFDAELTSLESLTQAQQQPTTGVTVNKTTLRETMGSAAMPVVGALQALATDLADADLAAQSDFTRTDFVHGPEIDSADNADIVHNLAVGRAAELADFGLAQAAIDALDAAIDAFRAAIGTPRLVTVTTSSATQLIAQAIARIDAIVQNSLDQMVEVIRPANPTFASQYDAARGIIDPGSPSAPPAPPAAELPGVPGEITFDEGALTISVAELPDGATSINAYRRPTAGGAAELAGSSTTTTASVIETSPLTAGVEYEFWIVGVNTSGEGPESAHHIFTAGP